MSQSKTTIEVWSDIVCPFCLLGKRKLEASIKKLDVDNRIEVVWKSFQLNPWHPPETSIPVKENLMSKKGLSFWQVERMTEQLAEHGKQFDVDFNTDKATVFTHENREQSVVWEWEQDLKTWLDYNTGELRTY